MSGERIVDFYYSIGSRYSYLASTQIPALERDTGCRVAWHPVDGSEVRRLRGHDPFAGAPVSGQYEWAYRRTDAARWAEYYGVEYREPVSPHFDHRLLVLAVVAAGRLGALVRYSHALFHAVWVDGVWPLDEGVCHERAVAIGLARDEFAEALAHPATEAVLRATAADAHRRGAFGVPTFFVGNRLFWGNDRLVLVRHALLSNAEG